MSQSPRPNILWICTDSQRFDALGCYGNPWVATPAADALAAQGTLFEHCYAQNPLCSPSRASFLTGRYPSTHRLRQNGQDIPASERLITRRFAEEGYVCGLSGKLHLSACDRRYELGPRWWERPEREWAIRGSERRIDDGYAECHWDHAPGGLFPSSAYRRWLQERGQTFATSARTDSRFVRNGMPAEHHQTTFCVDKALHFIEAYRDAPHPWLFSVNIFDPHFALDPPEDALARYLPRLHEVPLPNWKPGELDNKPPWQAARHKATALGGFDQAAEGDPHELRMIRAAYWAMCDHIDRQVARLIAALDAWDLRERTVIVFTSDHGEMLGDHGLFIKGPFLYDPAIRVPLIVSWPGHIPEGRRQTGLVELSDLAPTLLEWAGLDREPGMQTRSFARALEPASDPSAPLRDDVFCDYLNSNPDNPAVYLSMVRTARHKIVAAHGTPHGELYDLEADPDERVNLWSQPGAAPLRLEMMSRLAARMAFASADPLPRRRGAY